MTLRLKPTVHVCALRHVPDMVMRTGASHLISAINADLLPPTPATLVPERHLKLDMHDIVEARPDWTPPAERHVAELIAFAESWDRQAPLLIHCFAGLSRSTAAAFITLCALHPHVEEDEIARALRRSSATAVPNRLFVTLADKALARRGRMVAALESMGPHRVALECVPFEIEALPERTGTSRAA